MAKTFRSTVWSSLNSHPATLNGVRPADRMPTGRVGNLETVDATLRAVIAPAAEIFPAPAFLSVARRGRHPPCDVAASLAYLCR